MLVDIKSPQLEVVSALDPSTNETTAMYAAWNSYVQDTLEKLISYRKDNGSNQWLFDISNISEVKALITDLQEMTTHIPYEGQIMDMTKHVHIWFAVCPSNHALSDFFR